jgi:bacterioferritin
MAEAGKTAGLNLTREQMIQLLNEDLAREYEAMLEVNRHIDFLSGDAEAMPASAKTSNGTVEMIRAIMENERQMTDHYRQRIRQAEAMGEFALSEILREIIVQEDEINMYAVLGGSASLPKTDDNRLSSQ